MSANFSAAFCPAAATIPVCCGFDPHCAQKGASEGCGATRKLTVTVAEPAVPAAITVMCPVFIPAGSEPTAALICNVCGAIPLGGVAVSHGESLTSLKASVPPPVFETITDAAAGFAPPCTAVNDSEVDEMESTAGAGGAAP